MPTGPVGHAAGPEDVAAVLIQRRRHLDALASRARTKTRAALLVARADEVAQMHDQLAARGVARERTDDERGDLEVRED